MAQRKKRKATEDGEGSKKRVKRSPAPTSMRVTRNMKIDGPRQAVFNTAELLEQILLCLRIKQLFPIRRVSQQFRDCVNTSAKLQEKMFLRASQSQTERWALRTKSPLMPGLFFPVWDNYELVISTKEVSNQVKGAESLLPVRLNPLLSSNSSFDNMSAALRLAYNDPVQEYIRLDSTYFLKHAGSWHGMYLTNPPVEKGTVYMNLMLSTGGRIDQKLDLEVSRVGGLQLGNLLQTFLSSTQELEVIGGVAETRTRFTSIENLLTEFSKQKKKGHIIKQAWGTVSIAGIVIPESLEWERIGGESNATDPGS